MSESDRVQRWRQRMREEGKEPMTIWLAQAEKLRLEDLARTWRCSPSELVQQALGAYHPGSPQVPVGVSDTVQLRALIQQELAGLPQVTDMVTDTVTATLANTLPAVVRTLIERMQQEDRASTVTDTVTDSNDPRPVAPGDALPWPAFDSVRHRLGTLCQRGHDYQGTGQSLRATNAAGYCVMCNAENQQARRVAKAQARTQLTPQTASRA